MAVVINVAQNGPYISSLPGTNIRAATGSFQWTFAPPNARGAYPLLQPIIINITTGPSNFIIKSAVFTSNSIATYYITTNLNALVGYYLRPLSTIRFPVIDAGSTLYVYPVDGAATGDAVGYTLYDADLGFSFYEAPSANIGCADNWNIATPSFAEVYKSGFLGTTAATYSFVTGSGLITHLEIWLSGMTASAAGQLQLYLEDGSDRTRWSQSFQFPISSTALPPLRVCSFDNSDNPIAIPYGASLGAAFTSLTIGANTALYSIWARIKSPQNILSIGNAL